MKKNIILSSIYSVIIAAWAFFIGYNAGKAHVYSTSNEYYDHTEALLDSINAWNKPFMEAVVETDAYYEYELGREKYLK